MAEPFLGEMKMVGFNFAPRGWATCDGQILPINQNQSLYSLLGTTYGGDGRTTFALPDMRGRAPIHATTNPYRLGARGGAEDVTLASGEMPAHTHTVAARSTMGDSATPEGNVWARSGAGDPDCGEAAGMQAMSTSAVTSTGGSQHHTNMQPYLVLNWIIALQGVFPSRN